MRKFATTGKKRKTKKKGTSKEKVPKSCSFSPGSKTEGKGAGPVIRKKRRVR